MCLESGQKLLGSVWELGGTRLYKCLFSKGLPPTPFSPGAALSAGVSFDSQSLFSQTTCHRDAVLTLRLPPCLQLARLWMLQTGILARSQFALVWYTFLNCLYYSLCKV